MDNRCKLVTLSALMLFVEMTLIRWIGANIYYLFFFSNFILLASFLGIGIGFLRSQSRNWFSYTPVILALLVFFSYMSCFEYRAVVNPITDNLNYNAKAFRENLYPYWLTLPFVFTGILFLMAGIASAVANVFRQFSPLHAYRLEIGGSLLGVVLFSLLSYMHQGPVAWGVVILLLYSSLLLDEWKMKNFVSLTIQLSMFALMIGTFIAETSTFHHYWSSYYKIEVQEYSGNRYVVNVNGLAQQVIESVGQRRKVKPFYFVPYEQLNSNHPLDDVLVIGAGTGGDVAIALSKGAKHVDAVEIDPMIYQIGKKFNPDHPYADPRVQVYIDDGRAFLQRSRHKYDMIIYALTDSLALIGPSSLRLENFLYTTEGVRSAKQHLKPGGVFTLYNYYGFPWMQDRLANTFRQVYQHSPCITRFSPEDYWATVYTVSNDKNALNCEANWLPSGKSYEIPITDNHPFMYLKDSTLPPMYIFALSLLMVGSLISLRWCKISYHSVKNNLPMFLMGAAFLILETKNIVNFALFFGTTWLVNALVFAGILFTVYLSVEIRLRYKIPKFWLFAGLLLSLCSSCLVPADLVLSFPVFIRFCTAIFLAFTPILMANLLFADQFQKTANSTDAFGVNLLGAVLGGVLEYASLIIGYQQLLFLVILLYALTIISITHNKETR